MAFRSEAGIGAAVVLALGLASAGWGMEPLQYEARHDHLRKGGEGRLTVSAEGIAFEEQEKPAHAWRWGWDDIQQLTVEPRRMTVLTYQDNRWRLGADREYRFELAGGDFGEAHEVLKGRLDQRLVAAMTDEGEALWRLPAKHLLRFGGEHGALEARAEGLVFEARGKGESRTWRWRDIENVSRTGPFQLTVTTYERARGHYGNLKGFNFQLKQELDESRYDELWRRVLAGGKE